MKVLLIQSYLGGREAPVFPIGLASLAAALKADNHVIRALDLNTTSDPWKTLESEVRAFRPDVVGLSIRNIDSTNKRQVVYYYPEAKRAAAIVKATHPKATVVVGGSGFSMFAREIMRDEPLFDLGVYLEGEQTFPALMRCLHDPGQVPGVFYRSGEGIAFTGAATPQDMDEIPLPDRTVVPANAYHAFEDAFGIETKRGCPLSCVYCIYGFLNGKKYRFRSPARVVDDIESLLNQTGAQRYTFVDSIFNVPARHAADICAEIERRGIRAPWSAWFCESELDADLLDACRRAGCDHFIFSPDGFADSTLAKLGKKTRRRHILAGYKLVRDAGVRASYNFFKNPPGQCAANLVGMLAFVVRAKLEMRGRVGFEFSSLRVEPHTDLQRIAIEEGVLSGHENLLEPVGYTQKRTRFVERGFDLLLAMRGK